MTTRPVISYHPRLSVPLTWSRREILLSVYYAFSPHRSMLPPLNELYKENHGVRGWGKNPIPSKLLICPHYLARGFLFSPLNQTLIIMVKTILTTCSLSFNMFHRIIKCRVTLRTWLRWRREIWLPVTSLRMNSTQGCTMNLANSVIIVRQYCLLGARSWWLNLSVYCPHKTNNALFLTFTVNIHHQCWRCTVVNYCVFNL